MTKPKRILIHSLVGSAVMYGFLYLLDVEDIDVILPLIAFILGYQLSRYISKKIKPCQATESVKE